MQIDRETSKRPGPATKPSSRTAAQGVTSYERSTVAGGTHNCRHKTTAGVRKGKKIKWSDYEDMGEREEGDLEKPWARVQVKNRGPFFLVYRCMRRKLKTPTYGFVHGIVKGFVPCHLSPTVSFLLLGGHRRSSVSRKYLCTEKNLIVGLCNV